MLSYYSNRNGLGAPVTDSGKPFLDGRRPVGIILVRLSFAAHGQCTAKGSAANCEILDLVNVNQPEHMALQR